jgi:hypothetical protein
MATFSDMEIDPTTGLPKVKQPDPTTQPAQQLPYMNTQNPNTPLPIVQPQATDASLAQGNTNVMGQAQTMAQNPNNNGIAQTTDAMVKKMQSDPSFGYNGAQVKANTLSNFDYNQANAVKTFKDQNANLGGNGETNANLIKTMLQGNTDRSNLENTVDQQNVDRASKDWTAAIAAGNTQTSADSAQNTQNIQNLLNVRGAYEGERSQDQSFQDNVALTNLGFDHTTQLAAQQNGYDLNKLNVTYGQDVAKMVATQDWTGGQAALDRDAATAKQSNDIQAQKDIQDKQNAFDMEKLNKTQDWQSAQNKIDNDLKVAMQSNDISATSANIQKQLDLDKWKQENGQTFTADQNAMNRTLETALKTMDVTATSADKALDRELTAEIQAGNITMQEKTLAQSASQFATEDEFKKQALQSGVDEASADRIWKSSEAALDRSGAMDLKQLDIQSATDLTNLKAQIDKGMLVSQQDFQAAQNDIDNQLKVAMQGNDIQAQKDLTTLKGQIDEQAQTAQQNFQDSQRVATQTWQTGEQVSAQDAAKAAQYFDAQQKILLQSNDIAGQQALATQKNAFDLNMQTQSMDHDTAMAYLNDQFTQAGKDNDVQRQKDILSFTYNQDIAKMTAQQGFDTAKITLQGNIQTALQNGDFAHADAMQDALFTQQSAEHDKDLQEQQIADALKAKGMDYDMMKQAVDSGAATAADLNALIKASGINIQPIDPLASQKAADQKMQDMKYQFLLTHPEFVKDDNTVDEAGLRTAFNDYVNKANGTSSDVATKASDVVQNPISYVGSDVPGSKNHDAYIMLNNSASDFAGGYDKKGDLYQFKTAPSNGQAIRYNGNLLVVSSSPQVEKTDWAPNNQYFTAVDVKTGNTVKIYANQDPAAPYSGLTKIVAGVAGTVLGGALGAVTGATGTVVKGLENAGEKVLSWLGL